MEEIVPFAFEPLMTENELQTHEKTISQGKQAFIEVGKALHDINERRGYRFTHSTFAEYVEQRWGMSIRSGYEAMTASKVTENVRTSAQIGFSQAVAIGKLPPEQQQKFVEAHDIENMSVRETNEAVKGWEQKLREAEERAKKAEQEAKEAWENVSLFQKRANDIMRQNEELRKQKNPDPVVIKEEVKVEVVPERIKKQLEDDKWTINVLKNGRDELKAKIQELELQLPDKFDPQAAELKKKHLQMEADINVLQLVVSTKDFLQRNAMTGYATAAIAASEPTTKKKLAIMLDQLEAFITDVRAALNNRIIVEEATYQEA